MTKDEALKMAIEALPELISTAQSEYESQAKAYDGYPNMTYRYSYLKDIADNGSKAFNACKEALEQPIYTQEIMQQFIDNAILTSNLPKRTWQGLTNDEIRHCLYEFNTQDFIQFARAIEQALKEKNHGA
jgi:hypothetical protein